MEARLWTTDMFNVSLSRSFVYHLGQITLNSSSNERQIWLYKYVT